MMKAKNILRLLQGACEESAYFLSTMTLFNAIYALRIFGFNWGDSKPINGCNFFAFTLAMVLVTCGVVYTIIICARDHSIKNKNTFGKMVEVMSCKDITGDNYFSKYSLLVLTGNSLPMFHNFVGLAIYLIVLITIGLIFAKQKMYYMNPIVIILGYNVVQAECGVNGQTEEYYFIYKTGTIEVGQEIKFSNVGNRIVRLKEVKYEREN